MSASLSIRKGMSQARDVEQAAQDLYDALAQPEIKLAVFYCASSFDLPALAQALERRFHGVNLIGCTTAGEITPQGYLAGAITGFSLAGSELDVATQLINLDPFDSATCARNVTVLMEGFGNRDSRAPSAQDTFAFFLIDGLAMQEELVVSCVYPNLQGIELIGGPAGDDVRFGATHLYFQGVFRQNAALLTLVRTNLPFKAFRTQYTRADQRHLAARGASITQ